MKKPILPLLLVSMFLFNTSAITVSANSAQSHWSGVDSAGAIITDKNCPVIVENELLTFDISEFPDNYYENAEDFLKYSSKVTAEYTFYNPADYEVTATLVFPFGNLPDYAYDYYDSGKYVTADDTTKYNILINGEPTEKRVRHTLFDRHGQFDADEDIPLLCDDYISDSFLNPDTAVAKYQYQISGVDTSTYRAATIAMDIKEFDGKTKIMFIEANGMHTQKNGDMRTGTSVENGDVITLYIIGDQSYKIPEWKFYKDGGVEDNEEIAGTATLVPKGTQIMTFKDLALTAYKSESGIMETDWYNAMVADLNRATKSSAVLYFSEKEFDISDSLMRWYEYEIRLSAGERITNIVEAPMYPDINLRYNPAVFTYQYLLSPAKSWAGFFSLEIVVNTPYFITENNIAGFTKTDSGYIVRLNGLPDGEFEFAMSTVENPKLSRIAPKMFMQTETIIFFVVIALILAGGIIIFVIIRKKKKQ